MAFLEWPNVQHCPLQLVKHGLDHTIQGKYDKLYYAILGEWNYSGDLKKSHKGDPGGPFLRGKGDS